MPVFYLTNTMEVVLFFKFIVLPGIVMTRLKWYVLGILYPAMCWTVYRDMNIKLSWYYYVPICLLGLAFGLFFTTKILEPFLRFIDRKFLNVFGLQTDEDTWDKISRSSGGDKNPFDTSVGPTEECLSSVQVVNFVDEGEIDEGVRRHLYECRECRQTVSRFKAVR